MGVQRSGRAGQEHGCGGARAAGPVGREHDRGGVDEQSRVGGGEEGSRDLLASNGGDGEPHRRRGRFAGSHFCFSF